METFRRIVDDMPRLFPVPPEIQHQRVEITIRSLAADNDAASFKELLAAMPDVGNDDDFARAQDFGRSVASWDS